MTKHVLPPEMPEAAAAYVASMPEGRVELFPLAPLDRTGVSCWNAIFLNGDGTRWHGVAPHGVGYGVDDAGAIIGTTGELAEAVHSAVEIQPDGAADQELCRAARPGGGAGGGGPVDAVPAGGECRGP